MRSVALILFFVLLIASKSAAIGGAPCLKIRPALHQQLSLLLTSPRLSEKSISGIVVLQFQVSEDSRICRVQVFSGNAVIDAHFIRRLTGRKLRLSNPGLGEVHTIRVHFQPVERPLL
ncbi:hypothetical protein DUE52_23580 [Larkinella punicea]|jgi:hypothetical protein|uniref:TonB C-terminal domain-containing protein n=1 Tax=Larkinella punicea TaxID=2315727 RepID=A0A368JLM8_9BACT|nr:hypothetical protein DUE52_23580 [Larkinella punicea]